VTRTRRATGEALLVPPGKRRSQVRPITSAPGKWAEGERVEDGLVVAGKRGNARGAKEPYWSAMPPTTWKAGALVIPAPSSLQDLRRRLYVKAKADSAGRGGVGRGH
jgi:hypothetical protein